MYFDNAATTEPLPVDGPCVWANPLSMHQIGQESNTILSRSRQQVAEAIGVQTDSIIFTSGGTESTNLVFHNGNWDFVYTTVVEHAATYLSALRASTVAFLPNHANGLINISKLSAMAPHTPTPKRVLLSVILANNETGNVHSWETLRSAKQILQQRYACVRLHVDAVQAVGRMDVTIPDFVDFVSFSAHKFHGPHGCGILFCRKVVDLQHRYLQVGGGQEGEIRPGTHNVAGIMHTAHVLRYMQCQGLQDRINYMNEIKQVFMSTLRPFVKSKIVLMLTDDESALCNTLSFCVFQTDRFSLQQKLSSQGIHVGVGSACSVAKSSRILVSLNVPDSYSDGYLRFSWSPFNSLRDCHIAADVLKHILSTVSAPV